MNPSKALVWFTLLTVGGLADELPPIQSEVIFNGLDRIRISWGTQAGEIYSLQTTTNLAEPWQGLQTDPAVLRATTNQLTYDVVLTNQIQFFRVSWMDIQGPRLVPVYPRLEGIAVPRDSVLETRLWDPSDVDTNSIRFALGSQALIGLGDSRLSFTNSVLTFRPAELERLGEYGQNLTATVVAADGAGNRSTNLWPFQLELETILSTNILVVGGPGGRGMRLASPNGLTLVSRNGNLLVYRYSGGSSGLRQNMHLIDATAGKGYALTVLFFSEDPITQTVAVWTQPAGLADLVEEGSVSTRAALPNQPGGVGRHIWWEAGMDLSFEQTVPLNMQLFEWRQGENYVRAELTTASQFTLQARAGFAANFRNFTLKEFEVYAGGQAALNLELYAEANYQRTFEDTIPLITPPIYGHFVIPVAGVPVEITTKLEVDLEYELGFQAQGHFRNGIKVSKEIYLGRKWDGSWHDTTRNPSLGFEWFPVDWQVSGTLNARADVKPRMTVLLYGLAGLWADLDPYLELEGWAQVNPWQYEWGLYGGLDAHLGSDLTVFDRLFPNLSFEEKFRLIERTWITGDDNLVKPPRVEMSPWSTTVSVGAAAGFSVTAEGSVPMSYQWQRSGVNLNDGGRISGAKASVLRISGVQYSDAGDYRVIISNPAGSDMSAAATLTVTGGGGPAPSGMVLIPAGSFQMGDTIGDGWSDERPVHTVTLSGFYMDKYEVTKALWDEVRSWAVANGYSFDNAGGGKGANHPVHTVIWYDVAKWCNARSQREGRTPAYYTDAALTGVYKTGQAAPYVRWDRGYRLPTEAEWEYAARGGLSSRRFPWGDTISHSQANYYSNWEGGKPLYSYDVSPTREYHPTYATGGYPYTSPVGSFGANGYGLYDMAGNVQEWCWDWYGSYGGASQADPRGPGSGFFRALRGGGWNQFAGVCQVTYRDKSWPVNWPYYLGFRSVLPPGQ